MKPTTFQLKVMEAETERLKKIQHEIKTLREWRESLDGIASLLTPEELEVFNQKNKGCYEFIKNQTLKLSLDSITSEDYWEANGHNKDVRKLLKEDDVTDQLPDMERHRGVV